MPAIKGKKCADLVIDTLRIMKNDKDLIYFSKLLRKQVSNQKELRAMFITWRGPATALSKGILNLLTQSSLPSMINVNS